MAARGNYGSRNRNHNDIMGHACSLVFVADCYRVVGQSKRKLNMPFANANKFNIISDRQRSQLC